MTRIAYCLAVAILLSAGCGAREPGSRVADSERALSTLAPGASVRKSYDKQGVRPSTSVATSDLQGTSWLLLTLNGRKPIKGSGIDLHFGERELRGAASCNGYSADYSANSGKLSMGPVGNTTMGCPQPGMDQEIAYLHTFWEVTKYTVSDERLELSNEKGDKILVYGRWKGQRR